MGTACFMVEVFQICLRIYHQSPQGLQKKFRQNEVENGRKEREKEKWMRKAEKKHRGK